MDPRVNQEWSSSEIEEARSFVASLSNSGNYEDGNDKNKKHNDIVDVLHVWFPWKTMQQVTSLYVDLVVEMHAMKWKGESGANDVHDACLVSDQYMNDNFGIPEEEAMGNKGLVFDCPSEKMCIMKMHEAPMVEENKVVMLENQITVHQPAAPRTGRYWTTEEHRLFLRGLHVYGRGDWKNISKYFVKTRTPVQVSSHAQKYFRRLESSATSGSQRYSINDVRLHDADPWMMENSWQALASAGGHLDPTLGQAPASSFVTMNNLAQFWSPLLYCPQASQPAGSEQKQMVVSDAAPIEGAGNFVPDGQQGAYLPAELWMNNMH